MKISIFFVVLLLASVSFAQPSPTTLNVDPDKVIQTTDITNINQICIKKQVQEAFNVLAGEACTPVPKSELSLLINNTIQITRTFYQNSLSSWNNADGNSLVSACKRSTLSTQKGDVNTVIVIGTPERTDYVAFVHRYDSSMANSNPLLQYRLVKLVADIDPSKIPQLTFTRGTKEQTKYDYLGEVAFTYYLGKDLTISAPDNVTYFWKNENTSKEIESMPLSRAEFITCIEEELAKLP